MLDFSWSAGEKKLARRVFDNAVKAELAAFVSEFKAKAAAVQDVEAIWNIREWLDKRQREIDTEYDFRYSQIIMVFANLVRKQKLEINELAGLAEDKLLAIKKISEM
jgi:hypothetical protein